MAWAWAGCTATGRRRAAGRRRRRRSGAVGAGLRRARRRRFQNARRPTRSSEIRAAGRLARGPRVVAIGGGNGLAALLRGLKHHTSNLTAVVTVADDGGSSGRLRTRHGHAAAGRHPQLPRGAGRRRVADEPPLPVPLLQTAACRGTASATSSWPPWPRSRATSSAPCVSPRSVLKVRGRVLPSTLDDVVLHAQLEGGEQVSGESTITAAERLPLRVWLTPDVAARRCPQALAAIARRRPRRAGPGQPVHERHPQPAHPRGARQALKRHAGLGGLRLQRDDAAGRDRRLQLPATTSMLCTGTALAGLVDVVLVNDTPVSADLAASYEHAGARPVAVDDERLRELGLQRRARPPGHGQQRRSATTLRVLRRPSPRSCAEAAVSFTHDVKRELDASCRRPSTAAGRSFRACSSAPASSRSAAGGLVSACACRWPCRPRRAACSALLKPFGVRAELRTVSSAPTGRRYEVVLGDEPARPAAPQRARRALGRLALQMTRAAPPRGPALLPGRLSARPVPRLRLRLRAGSARARRVHRRGR